MAMSSTMGGGIGWAVMDIVWTSCMQSTMGARVLTSGEPGERRWVGAAPDDDTRLRREWLASDQPMRARSAPHTELQERHCTGTEGSGSIIQRPRPRLSPGRA